MARVPKTTRKSTKKMGHEKLPIPPPTRRPKRSVGGKFVRSPETGKIVSKAMSDNGKKNPVQILFGLRLHAINTLEKEGYLKPSITGKDFKTRAKLMKKGTENYKLITKYFKQLKAANLEIYENAKSNPALVKKYRAGTLALNYPEFRQ